MSQTGTMGRLAAVLPAPSTPTSQKRDAGHPAIRVLATMNMEQVLYGVLRWLSIGHDEHEASNERPLGDHL